MDSDNEMTDAYKNAMANSITGRTIVEQFMEGPELSLDTLVYKGEVHLLTIADRHIEFPPFFVETGHTVPSRLPKEKLDELFNVMKRGIKALGIQNGASKADMKMTPGGAMIGEITARLSGGFHCQVTDPLATGMRSIKAAIDIAIGNGLNVEDITPKYNRGAAERAIMPPPGRVVHVSGVNEAEKLHFVERVVLNVKPGDIVNPLRSNIGKAGHVIVSGIDADDASGNAEKALRLIKIRTVPVGNNPEVNNADISFAGDTA